MELAITGYEAELRAAYTGDDTLSCFLAEKMTSAEDALRNDPPFLEITIDTIVVDVVAPQSHTSTSAVPNRKPALAETTLGGRNHDGPYAILGMQIYAKVFTMPFIFGFLLLPSFLCQIFETI